MENNQFENSFRDAFNGAEISPSEAVWKGIELDLEKASGGKMKRNLLLFQLLAAASVTFAFGVTALYYLDKPVSSTEKQNSLSRLESREANTESTPKENESPVKQNLNDSGRIATVETSKKQNTIKFSNTSIVKNRAKETTDLNESYPLSKSKMYSIERTEMLSLVKTRTPVLVIPEPEKPIGPDAGMLLLARLKDEEEKYQKEDRAAKKSRENIWASVGFGAGSYKPNREYLDGNTSKSSTGESYTAGVNVAGKVSQRLIIQGGISYLSQNADFTSTRSDHGVAMLNEFAKTGAFYDSPGTLDGGQPSYSVNSSMQYVSIPVQAGYLIVDRAFGIQLNGGIATDLFLSNTLAPLSDDYKKVTQSAGKDSPYRTVNFSGLLGSEFSYRVTNQYRISLNPGLRYSLNSIYKDGVAAEIVPVTFDVSLRFRYIFK